MNKEAANTLKTLEEPGDHCLFVLVTSEPKALLKTIISRCQHVKLKPQSREDLSQVWIQEGCERSKSEVLAAMDLRGFGVTPETLSELRPLALGWLTAVHERHRVQELELAEG